MRYQIIPHSKGAALVFRNGNFTKVLQFKSYGDALLAARLIDRGMGKRAA